VDDIEWRSFVSVDVQNAVRDARRDSAVGHRDMHRREEERMTILWIILVVVMVVALLGFVGRSVL
jgi:flagellar basal body-associated protein FliL